MLAFFIGRGRETIKTGGGKNNVMPTKAPTSTITTTTRSTGCRLTVPYGLSLFLSFFFVLFKRGGLG